MVAASFGGAAVKSVALGEYHMLCLNAKGDVYSCGRNDYHQLGNAGASVSVPVPVAIGEFRIARNDAPCRDSPSDGRCR